MGEQVEAHRPARGYSWAPFEKGNLVALKHGAFSPRKVDPIARGLVEMALGQATMESSPTAYLADPSYLPALWAWGRAEAQAQLLTEYLAAAAEAVDEDVADLEAKRVRSAYTFLHQAEARAGRLRNELGLTPLSRARLGRDVAAGQVDLARVMAALDEGDGKR